MESITIHQAANFLNIGVETLRRYIKNGKIQAYKLPGGHYRIKRDDLLSFTEGKEMTNWAIASTVTIPTP